jgi:D-aminoacyl-tRNA deacylase
VRAVVQRVREARVDFDDATVAEIGRGIVVLLGIGANDAPADVDYLARRIANLRIFDDDEGRMNRSVLDVDGEVLVVSQFTLWGDCRKGRRPSYVRAAPAERARSLYRTFLDVSAAIGLRTAEGRFQARMNVHLVNDGPVTLLLDSTGAF